MTAITQSPDDNRHGPIHLEIEWPAIKDLKGYARHARKHPERQLVNIAGSINAFGFVSPILIDRNNVLVTGHARVEAAKRTGLATVPAIRLEHLDDAQVRALRLADNRLVELASWDEETLRLELTELHALDLNFSLEIMGWELSDIDLVIEGHASTSAGSVDPADEDGVEPEPTAITQVGDVWCLGKHRLLCGSSLDPACWHALMDGATATMVFTDPPYNVPVKGHVSGLGKVQHREFAMGVGEMSEDAFVKFLTDAIGNAAAHVTDGAVLMICMDWRHLFELQFAVRSLKLEPLNLCVWNKSNGGMGSLWRSKHELVLAVKKGKGPHINNVQLGKHGRYRTNVWDYAGVNSFGRNRMEELEGHPTCKPVSLVADAIRDVTHLDDIVVDAFMGSGSTLLAAERTRRVGYGIELDPIYVDLAIRRWEKMTGQQAMLEGSDETFAEVAARRSDAAEQDDEPPMQPTIRKRPRPEVVSAASGQAKGLIDRR